MKVAYTSENKIYLLQGGKSAEIPCGRIKKYYEAIDSIRRRNEWKTSGSGAAFTGAAAAVNETEPYVRISGLCGHDGGLIYGVTLDASSSLYMRSLDRTDENEGLILSGNDISFGSFDSFDGQLAFALKTGGAGPHIAVLTPPSSLYTEYTDGDTIEESPYWSRHDKNRIYFSTAGYARGGSGAVEAISPRSGAYIDIDAGELIEFISDPKTDFLKIKDDSDGNIYYIRQPYGGERPANGIKPSDILLFPVRIIKALFGWLNFMSAIWGGESLKNGDTGIPGFSKAKNRTRKDVIIDGNVISAKKLAKLQSENGEQAELMPLSRVLVKRTPDGEEAVIKRGVLDYALCADGGIIISNGIRISLISPDGSERTLGRAYLATELTEVL